MLRRVAVPTEHGGWSLTIEPALLGLLAAPSAAGALLGCAAVMAFVARTPLKVVLIDRLRSRRLARTALARQVLAVEAVVLVGLVIGAAALADAAFWPPLLAALPLVAVALWYDARSRSRRLVPELAGTVGIAAVAAAVALAGGLEARPAWGLWLVAAARVIAAVFFVRLQLRRAKGQPADPRPSTVAQIGAIVAVGGGVALGMAPVVAVVAVAVMAAAHVVLQRLEPPAAPVLGAQQVVLGLAVVIATALGVRAPG